ncbi:MAG: hypothetical protein IPJ78_19420, partial [Gemmatimonadetes bacterium]|nr:hypothetical protein [Gemmatimonadota bacterium]
MNGHRNNLTPAGLPLIHHVPGLFLLAAPDVVAAQAQLSGRLLDESSGRILACWGVFLVDSAGTTRDSTVTGTDGTFAFALSKDAAFRLRMHQSGLSDVLSDVERVGDGNRHESYDSWIPRAPTSRRDAWSREEPGPHCRSGSAAITFAVDTLGRVDVSSA